MSDYDRYLLALEEDIRKGEADDGSCHGDF